MLENHSQLIIYIYIIKLLYELIFVTIHVFLVLMCTKHLLTSEVKGFVYCTLIIIYFVTWKHLLYCITLRVTS